MQEIKSHLKQEIRINYEAETDFRKLYEDAAEDEVYL